MLTQQEIINKLKSMVTEKRFNHSLRVQEISTKLAKLYGADVQKASLAGILHDCAKGYNCEESLKLCDKYGIVLDDITRRCRQLIHAPLGAKVAQLEFGVDDKEVLNAIYYHTTGHENMSLLEKVVCTADYIEPARDFIGIEAVREMAYKDIDKALAMALGSTINFVISRNYILHPMTVMARNSLIINASCK